MWDECAQQDTRAAPQQWLGCESGRASSRCVVPKSWVEILDFVFHFFGLRRGPPGISGDESEGDEKQDCAHIWSQTPPCAGAIGFSSLLWPDWIFLELKIVGSRHRSCRGKEPRGLGWGGPWEVMLLKLSAGSPQRPACAGCVMPETARLADGSEHACGVRLSLV